MRVKRRAPLKSCCSTQEKTPSDHKLRGRTCWNLHLLQGNRTNSWPGFPSGPWNGRLAPPVPTRHRVEDSRVGAQEQGGGPVRESVRPTLPVVGVVLAVVALVLGASVVQAMIGIPAQEAGSGHGADQPAAARRADPTTLLDLGQVSSSEQVATCLSPSFAA